MFNREIEVVKKYIVTGFVLLFLIGIINATVFQQNEDLDFSVPVDLDGSAITIGSCTLNIKYPNGTYMINNGSMTNSYNGEFNITIPKANVTEVGNHHYSIFCVSGIHNDSDKGIILITPTGNDLTDAQGTVYIITLIGIFFAFALCLWGAIAIPSRHKRNDEGKVVAVSDLKYVKMILWAFSYLLLMWIFFMLSEIARNFLFSDVVSRIFYFIFYFFLILMFPLVVVFIIITIMLKFQDKKTTDLINRGVTLE